ncbi:hypothetical protein BGX31_005191, partial [Mortierella sp. GBA43]
MVPIPPSHDLPRPVDPPSARRSHRLAKRSRPIVEEPELALVSLERQRRQAMIHRGLNETTVNLIYDAAIAALRRKAYKGIQLAFLKWCIDNDHDFFTPDSAVVTNFLAEGPLEHPEPTPDSGDEVEDFV